MFIQTVEFKRKETSPWEKGFYIGRTGNDEKNKSIYLDANYQPLPRDTDKFQVWDSRFDTDRDIELSISIKGEFSKEE